MMYKVAAFYRFVRIENIPALRAEMKDFCAAHNVLGTILIAPEGVNGTISALPDDLDKAVLKL
jgi:UPF0176 protein